VLFILDKDVPTPAGTIRYTTTLGKVSRLAVLKEYRQFGLGRELMLEVEKYMSGTLKLHAQIQAIGFYERLGYAADGERFDEDGGKIASRYS
jgi:predicted GNAT family N-acyltransferase